MKALGLSEDFSSFFGDVDETLLKQFGKMTITFQIVGFVALSIAGLPRRRTKDIDALKSEALASPNLAAVIKFLEDEFGKKSPGLHRHGMYLDFVPENIIWLPPEPRFSKISAPNLHCLKILSLDPLDVCASKAFSYLMSMVVRNNDRNDIFNCIEQRIVDIDALVHRLDITLPRYEIDSRFPDVYQKIVRFIDHDLAANFESSASLKYCPPNWMANM